MKIYSIIILFFFSIQVNQLFGQNDSTAIDSVSVLTIPDNNAEIYRIKKGIDIPVSFGLAGYTLYGFSKIYGRDKTPEAEILALNRNNINNLDRRITENYSTNAKNASDMFFYSSMPLPLILMLDKKIRKDGIKVGLLYLQAVSITGALYTSSAMIANRFRPYAYNPEVDLDTRRRGGAKNSFFAGHPALVATSVFFTAKVYSDYHPGSKINWVFYTVAGAAAAATGILRIKAGQHFISDVVVGVPVGVLTGILVPHIHKIRGNRDTRLSIYPQLKEGATGFTALYKLK